MRVLASRPASLLLIAAALFAVALAFALPGGAAAQAEAWYGEYFATPHLVGQPALVRNDAAIDFDWGEEAPAPGLPQDEFAVRWSRFVEFEEGTYTFYTTTDDGVRLYVDDLPVINAWHERTEKTRTGTARLAAGQHAVRMEFFDSRGSAVAQLRWEKNEGAAGRATPVPSVPALASPAATPRSDSTATPPGGTSSKPAPSVYVVQRGDSLREIAARFGRTLSELLAANPRIRSADRIFIGQRIAIPAGSTGDGSAAATPTRAPGAAGGSTRQVQIFLIGEGTGSVGCGDEVVGVQRDIPRTAGPLRAALDLLLAQRERVYGESGLYNALYQSDLRVQSLARTGDAWTVNLTGTLRLGGVCDNPRVLEQLRQTALQFATVRDVRFLIDGVALETVLSGK